MLLQFLGRSLNQASHALHLHEFRPGDAAGFVGILQTSSNVLLWPFYWVALKELILSYHSGETILSIIYRYTHTPLW